MNNTEFDNFNNVAPNAEHINKQDCAIKSNKKIMSSMQLQ